MKSKIEVIEKQAAKLLSQYFINYNPVSVDDSVCSNCQTLEEISNSKQMLHQLKSVDWSFTEDDTAYLSHDIHPYPAKFIPQIPATLIKCLSLPGELIWDPFGGCGTTALEAIINNRRCVSTDINPIGRIIGKAKTTTLTSMQEQELLVLLDTIEAYTKNPIGLQKFLSANKDKLSKLIPDIPNINKWFCDNVICELAMIKYLIAEHLTFDETRTIAQASLSKIITKASNQESETRYCAKEKQISDCDTLQYYIRDLRTNFAKVKSLGQILRYRDASFVTANVMDNIVYDDGIIVPDSIDLVVTSPPYPNAFDYHLYHRFRIFWLDGDPVEMGKNEIGSHLKYQKQRKGFDFFCQEMKKCLLNFYQALKPGRYAVLVLGDAIFDGETYNTAELIGITAEKLGFEKIGIIERPLHKTKRSMQNGAQRAKNEQLLILQKPSVDVKVMLHTVPYKMWQYEKTISNMELTVLFSQNTENAAESFEINSSNLDRLNNLTFYSSYSLKNKLNRHPTWQSIIENGDASSPASRKDPKYITHGIHPYKGKFYPQLAKSLLNISAIPKESKIFDPFCGSGTVALECSINGYEAYGCDVNPLAVEIAKAKTDILFIDPYYLNNLVDYFLERIGNGPIDQEYTSIFDKDALTEIKSWFPLPVVYKLGYILTLIERVEDIRIQRFLKVVLSSIIKQVSQQEPTDLRIRRRKIPLEDAPVYDLYSNALNEQRLRLVKFAKIRHRAPNAITETHIWNGNSSENGIFQYVSAGSIDTIITSPPYATALPYIDTNRLNILVLFGLTAKKRTPLEAELTGTREISKQTRAFFENLIELQNFSDISSNKAIQLVQKIYQENLMGEVGFRKKNMAALLYMYFNDMSKVFNNLNTALKHGGKAFVVIGDTKTTTSVGTSIINTTEILDEIGRNLGWSLAKKIDISVTTENYKHISNAITKNAILCFEK